MNPAVRDLQEQSTWRLLGLDLVTFGVYSAFYIRRQTLKANRHLPVGDRIPLWLCDVVIASSLLSVALLVPYWLVPEGHFVEDLSDAADILAIVGAVVWAFAARGRMNRLLRAEPGSRSWFHGLWTFLFTALYFNYKINVLAGPGLEPDPGAGSRPPPIG